MLKINNNLKACIIGNSVSLKGSGLGRKIDSYEHVIRCNYYHIKGYEKDVGVKTTIWLVSAVAVAKLGNPNQVPSRGHKFRDCSDIEEVWVRTGLPKYTNAVIDKLKNVKTYYWLKPSSSSVVGDWSKIFFDNKIIPTTGLVGIVHSFSRWSPPLDIIGFGVSDSIDNSHYEESRVPSWSHHNIDIERILINKWVKEGLVSRIDENNHSIP